VGVWTVRYADAERRVVVFLRGQHLALALDVTLPGALLGHIVPLQLLFAPDHIVDAAHAVMENVAVDGVSVLVVGLVRTECGLARGHRDYVACAVDFGLPVAHFLLVVPDELVGTLLGIVNSGETVVVDVAEFRVGEVAVRAERALQSPVDDCRNSGRIVEVVDTEVHVRHVGAVKVNGQPRLTLDLGAVLALHCLR